MNMRRKWYGSLLLALMLFTGVFVTPVNCFASEDKQDLIAGEEEKAPAKPVAKEGMVPVYAENVKEGSYPVEVDSSSSMFRIVDAVLTVADGKMTAVITLGGKGYLKLYMGTGEQAVEADETAYVPFVENEEGAYTYEVTVEALNQELECTGFSKRKEKWYDHQILFVADSLPEGALLAEAEPAAEPQKIQLADGTYRMEVSLSGGSGRASVTAPALVRVQEGKAVAVIEWSSPNYDYMVVNGEKYLPVNGEGNSRFEIPVLVFDEEMPVLADTTAMGTPHEIEYTLTFYLNSAKKAGPENRVIWIAALGIVCVCGCAAGLVFRRRRKNKHVA